MKFSQNIGVLNGFIRITAGLTLLSWATAKFTRKQRKNSYLLIAFLAAMKVAEGITKYCPATDLAESLIQGRNTDEKPKMKKMIDLFVPKIQENTADESGFGQSVPDYNQSNENGFTDN